ncbi:MAG: hypothetical protein ACFFG0_51635 [Candidatus Thorarchaeota archaeon]
MQQKQYTITKKIAKHGEKAILIIPTCLKEQLKPGTVVEISMEIIN